MGELIAADVRGLIFFCLWTLSAAASAALNVVATTPDLKNIAEAVGGTLVNALIHWLIRKPLIEISFASGAPRTRINYLLWDFVFYTLFGVVVTSSVAVAGVLLVFSFLIIPAMIGMLYTARLGLALLLGCLAGAFASLVGLSASYLADLPTGAAMVCAFGLTLALAGLLKPFFSTGATRWQTQFARLGRLSGGLAVLLLLSSALWLTLNPRADQPLIVWSR